MLIGDSVRRCERNKMWTGTEPTCKGTYYILTTIIYYFYLITVSYS